MGHGHGHGHATAAAKHRPRLIAVFAMTVSYMVVQIIGGLMSGSLSLLGDAGHMATDAGGIALALFAVWIAGRPACSKRTFGYQRAEILAAAVNALALFALCAYILYEAIQRVFHPEPVAGPLMLAVASVGLAVNIAGMLVLRAGAQESLNLRGAYLEVLGDMVSSLGVIVAGVIIWTTGWQRADSLVAIGIALFIIPRAWSLLREALHVLLEAAPRGVDLDQVRAHILTQPGVLDVHDLHAWTITSGVPVMSAHVVVEDAKLGECGTVLDDLHTCLAGHFDVEHSTLQLEPAGHVHHEGARHP